jgi:hypothetical protein
MVKAFGWISSSKTPVLGPAAWVVEVVGGDDLIDEVSGVEVEESKG